MSNTNPEDWGDWIHSFRERFIAAQGWNEKEAKLRIRDGWACVRDGRVCYLTDASQLPADAVPIFYALTPGGWKPPIWIPERLIGLVTRAMTSDRPPRDIVMGILEASLHTEGRDESEEITRRRHTAALWVEKLLAVCEHEELSGVAGSDVFWSTLLAALFVGRQITVLELYKDPQAFHDMVKAQAFQSGRSPDEVSKRLEASRTQLRTKLGREPTPPEVVEAAGGVWSEIDDCWEFEDIDGLPSLSNGALYDRLAKIRGRHP